MSARPNVGQRAASPAALPETYIERACRILCEVALLAMVVMISGEVVARLFNFSFEMVDEVGGYLLSALTFLSMPVALIGGAYHQVDYFRLRTGPHMQAGSSMIFTLLSLAFACVLAWQLVRLVIRSHGSSVVAPTMLGTQLWIPQSFMLLGIAALIYALLRIFLAQLATLKSVRGLRNA
jgi:TRAP-type C4-dicarboxylate transport system permease small subunit